MLHGRSPSGSPSPSRRRRQPTRNQVAGHPWRQAGLSPGRRRMLRTLLMTTRRLTTETQARPTRQLGMRSAATQAVLPRIPLREPFRGGNRQRPRLRPSQARAPAGTHPMPAQHTKAWLRAFAGRYLGVECGVSRCQGTPSPSPRPRLSLDASATRPQAPQPQRWSPSPYPGPGRTLPTPASPAAALQQPSAPRCRQLLRGRALPPKPARRCRPQGRHPPRIQPQRPTSQRGCSHRRCPRPQRISLRNVWQPPPAASRCSTRPRRRNLREPPRVWAPAP